MEWPLFNNKSEYIEDDNLDQLIENLGGKDIIIGGNYLEFWRAPDIVIAPNGEPYLYRWHIVSDNKHGNIFFHLQVADDPERPPHDHPWDNTSIILVGGYDEIWNAEPERLSFADTSTMRLYPRHVGDVVHRKAAIAHRLLLPAGIPYTMTLFVTGPKIRDWGFWYPKGWVHNKEVVELCGNVSTHRKG